MVYTHLLSSCEEEKLKDKRILHLSDENDGHTMDLNWTSWLLGYPFLSLNVLTFLFKTPPSYSFSLN